MMLRCTLWQKDGTREQGDFTIDPNVIYSVASNAPEPKLAVLFLYNGGKWIVHDDDGTLADRWVEARGEIILDATQD